MPNESVSKIVIFWNCGPNLMTWLPLTQLALSSHSQVCVSRPWGRKSGSGLVNAVPEIRYPEAKLCDVEKNAGARSNPKRSSLVKVGLGFQRQAVDKKWIESLF